MYEYKAVVLGFEANGYVRLAVELGLGATKEATLALHGVRIVHRRDAVRMLEQDLPVGTVVVLTAHHIGGGVWTATLYREGQSMNVNNMLVAEGFAVELDGTSSTKAGK